MEQHELRQPRGATKARKRIGRGNASGTGTYSGKGMKGAQARAGYKSRPAFEGGQTALVRRLPRRRGFRNPFRVEYQGINLDTIEGTDLDEISPATLHAKGIAHKGALIKVLGRGELTRKVTVKAHAFSKSAEEAITAAGGTVEVLPKPWGDRRPPVKGNQFANR